MYVLKWWREKRTVKKSTIFFEKKGQNSISFAATFLLSSVFNIVMFDIKSTNSSSVENFFLSSAIETHF